MTFHLSFFSDARRRVRPDLRAEGLEDFQRLPLAAGWLWVSAGPNDGMTSDGVTPAPMANGGLVSSIAVHPDDSDDITVGTRAGGVWRSTDGGAAWTALGDGLSSLQTVVVDVTERSGHPPILVAGTGALNEEKRRHAGLMGGFRSVDGGGSWSNLDGGPGATVLRSHDINRLVSLDRDRILVASRIGLFFSKDGGRNFGDNDPDYDDGTPVLRGDVTDLVVSGTQIVAVISLEPPAANDPRPPEIAWQVTAVQPPGVYAGELGGDGLVRSSPGDPFLVRVHDPSSIVAGGDIGLTRLARANDHFMISAAALEVPRDTMAQIDAIRRGGHPHHSIQVTHHAFPPTAGWASLPHASVEVSQTDFSHVVALEPSSRADRVSGWFGTVKMFKTRADNGRRWAWGQTDESGTISWPGPSREGIHVDQHAIVVEPGRVLVGNDGGVFSTTDGGTTWHPHNTHNAFMLWTINLARTATGEARLMAGVQDNGTFVGEGPFDPSGGGWRWQRTGPGDGGPSAWIPQATSRQPGDDPQAALITFNGLVARASGTAVGSWSAPSSTTWPSGFDADADQITQGFIYSETLALARGAGGDWDRIYFGRSDERHGPGTLFRGEGGAQAAAVGGQRAAVISALAAAPHAAETDPWNELWFGLVNGDLFHSTDAGASTPQETVDGAFTGADARPITAIAVDPENHERVAVAYGGYAETGRRESARKVFLKEPGQPWRDISGTPQGTTGFVPDIPVLGAAFTRTTPPVLVLATDLGVIMTEGPSYGATWKRLGVGLPRCPIAAISVLNPDPGSGAATFDIPTVQMAVTAFGRGAFMLTRPADGTLFIDFDGGFGAMARNERRRRTLTVHNLGTTDVTLTTVTAPSRFSFENPSDPAGRTVPARGSLTVDVVCQPDASGILHGNLQVGSASDVRSIPVSCECFDVGKPRLAVSRRNVRFGPVPDGSAATETVTLTNVGQAALHIQHVQPFAGGSNQLTVDGGGAHDLPPGGSVDLTVRFAASGSGQHRERSFLVTSDDPVGGDAHHTIHVSGTVGPSAPSPPPPAPSGDGGIPGWGWALIGIGIVAVVAVGIGVGVAVAEDD